MPNIDITDDFAIFDNTEAGTLTIRLAAGDSTIAITNALRSPLSTVENGRMGGMFETDRLSFFFPAGEATTRPSPGDAFTVTSSSVVYTIENVSDVAFGNSVSGYSCQVTPER
tara:strand:+ start:2327 stop:2665 length:339 start_codon:yes stop_codon:yes gene_type:complete